MENGDIERVIARELNVVANGRAVVTPDTNIARDLGLDSMAVMDLTMALEDHFDISIPLDQIAQTETVNQLANLIRALKAEAEAEL
ncbi:MAG: acyl carrier protein [Paracoccus sp. (in: a-proteobacteria)]